MTLPRVSVLHPNANFILGIGQSLGSIAAGLPQNGGRLHGGSPGHLHDTSDFHLLV
jgi:hypothetical protein